MLFPDELVPGGHRVQATKTAEALRVAGAQVDVATPGRTGWITARHVASQYDVVHAFRVPLEALRLVRQAGVPLVLTPIWWSAEYVHGDTLPRLRWRRAILTGRVLPSMLLRGPQVALEILRRRVEELARSFELADLLLPNSDLEADQIRTDTGVTTPMHVVPNGVDAELFSPPAQGAHRAGVLCVGRLEPHKNQLGLIRSLRGTGIDVRIIGPEHPHHAAYAAACRSAADGHIQIIAGVPHEELPDLYRSAAVHVLPSWFETTGLSSLEAAAAGCSVVTTNRGYAREYFLDLAHYCDPGARRSIRDAVYRALEKAPSGELRRRVLENFTWEHVARATLDAYETVTPGSAGIQPSD